MSSNGLVRAAVGRLGNLLERAWNAANPYPPEWSDRGRLRRWEAQHVDPRCRVWVLRCNNGVLELYAPGSPQPCEWPGGDDPYHRVAPFAATFEPAAFMPYPPGTLAELIRWVEMTIGGDVVQHESGIRWAGDGRWGEPIIYLACTR